jgi:hypothetical protein
MPDSDFPDRDELDGRIERALHVMTRSRQPLSIPSSVLGRQPRRGVPTWSVIGASAAAAVLAVGALLTVQILREAAQTPSSSAGPTTGSASPTRGAERSLIQVDVQAWMETAWPSLIPGRFGTVESTAYDADPGTTLGHLPAVEGEFDERWFGGPAGTTYTAVADPGALADSTQLIVRGRAVAFSRPYFNSTTGEFWRTDLVGPREGVNADDDLQRDVLFQVEEVLGTTLPGGFEPGLVQFTVTAGQVVVDVPKDVAYDGHVLEAGRYLIREQPGAELRVGEEVVLFLRYAGWLGLDGDRYGTVTTLTPAHPLYYAFRVEGDGTSNLSTQGASGDQWSPSITDLRDIALDLAPRPDQPIPDARVHPARPTHDSNEQPLPSPTPCAPQSVQDYWAGYDTLDALLAESDLIVVGRPTTRSRDIVVRGDTLAVLQHDVLVERVFGGAAMPGQLLPVERLAARDPACELVVDGNPPLAVDRPYVMALRREGESLILPEAPLALAEIRDGRLVSSRWPELDGLAVEAAGERLAPTALGGVEGLKADLRAAGATVEQVRTFPGRALPFAGLGVELCVDGQRVDTWVYDSVAERATDAALIDRDDPRHVGDAIAEWQGRVMFWERDRVIVLYLGGQPNVAQVLGSVLGQPVAQNPPGDTGPSDHDC